jgi:hypothetical protein
MTDQWGRPTVYDGLTAMRGFMAVQDFQQKQKKMDDEALVDKYLGKLSKGEEISQDDPGYSAVAETKAMAVENERWQLKQTDKIREAEQKLTKMRPQQILSYQPTNYAERIVVKDLVQQIREDTTNRQEIENLNKQKALESYHHSTLAFNEAREKYARGDYKGASDDLAKIGMITNNPFKVKPSEDGKTVELYWTKDGVDQPGQQMPIDQAMDVAQKYLNSNEFFTDHLQHMEARRRLNEESIQNPKVFKKGDKQLRATRDLDLHTNQVRWTLHDENGDRVGEQLSDLGSILKQGWMPYDSKQAKEELGAMKTAAEINKIRQQTLESAAKTENVKKGGTTPKSWKKDWWPALPEEAEGGSPIITEARGVAARAYDNASTERKNLITTQVLPQYKTWVEANKDRMVVDEDGTQRPINSQELQNVFDHIAYDVTQKQGGKTETAAPAKEPSRKPMKEAEPEKAGKPVEPGMIEAGNIDLEKRPVIQNKDGSVSTELSFSIGTDKGEVLIPQIVNGKKVSKQEAIDHYKKTGEHLGIFKDPKSATAYAEKIHNRGQAFRGTTGSW